MATYSTSAVTTPAVSATGTLQRTVDDKIRHLFPGNPILLLVAGGSLAKGTDFKAEKGLISKRRVNTPKYEVFNYTPLAIEFTVATFTSVASFTVSSADGLTEKMTIVNTANNTTCRISSITSTTLVCVTVGSTTFTATADDVLVVMGPAYGENSSTPYILSKDEDNYYNYCQIFRFPVAISASARDNPHYGGNYWTRLKARNIIEGLRKVENSLIWGNRASSGDTTSDSTLSDTFRTTRGLWNWATVSYPAGGSMDYEKLSNDLILAMSEYARGQGKTCVMPCSQKVNGQMVQWAQDKMIVNDSKEIDEFGAAVEKYRTSGPLIRPIVHDSFTRGSNGPKALVFDPEDIEYVYLRDRDFQPRNGIQTNSTDGYEDEIFGEIGINSLTGGTGLTQITNWY